MKRCSKCLNDSTVRNISFNENNVCNYCEEYEKIKDKLNDSEKLSELFKGRIDKIKGKYDYDVALGISGGKDSMFVLYELINKYHLKVKAFTMNNGFLSNKAKENIDKIVKEFGVEHEYIEFDPELLRKFYKYSMKHFLVPCVACSYIGYASMINYTTKINAGMCVHGRSPEQMLRCYGKDVFTNFVDLGLRNINDIDISKEYRCILKNIGQKLDKNVLNDVESMLYDEMGNCEFREFVPYFLYHEYDEKEIVEFLKKNTSWEPRKDYNHYDCEIHNACKYIYQKAEGRAHRLPETSVLIRSGRINKDEAKEILKKEIIDKPIDEINSLCKYAGVNKTALFLKAKLYNWYLNR